MAEPSIIGIRRYKDADLDGVISVFLESIRQVAVREYNQAQISAWAQVDRDVWRSRRLSRPTWVAFDRELIVGFADLEPDGHLDMMYVHHAYQGRGIASALLAAVERLATEQGLAGISVDASLTAKRFFENRGFTLLKEQRVAVRGEVLVNFRMFKSLHSAAASSTAHEAK